MLAWIIAALVGAVPLYFGVAFGRNRSGLALLTGLGVLLTLVVVGLGLATSGGPSTLSVAGLGVAYVAGVGVIGVTAGLLAQLIWGAAGK